jgi:hypothetical protein
MELKLGVDFSRETLLENYPTAKSFPVITVDGFYIGGYSQLAERINTTNSDNRELLTG